MMRGLPQYHTLNTCPWCILHLTHGDMSEIDALCAYVANDPQWRHDNSPAWSMRLMREWCLLSVQRADALRMRAPPPPPILETAPPGLALVPVQASSRAPSTSSATAEPSRDAMLPPARSATSTPTVVLPNSGASSSHPATRAGAWLGSEPAEANSSGPVPGIISSSDDDDDNGSYSPPGDERRTETRGYTREVSLVWFGNSHKWKSKADLSYDPFFPDAKDKFLEAYDQGSSNWNMKINHVEYKFEVIKSERGWIKQTRLENQKLRWIKIRYVKQSRP